MLQLASCPTAITAKYSLLLFHIAAVPALAGGYSQLYLAETSVSSCVSFFIMQMSSLGTKTSSHLQMLLGDTCIIMFLFSSSRLSAVCGLFLSSVCLLDVSVSMLLSDQVDGWGHLFSLEE